MIEDSATDVELLRLELAMAWPHAAVDVVRNRSEFDAWVMRHETPDVVLCDSRLPALHGTEAMAVLREIHPDVPFVFCAGALDGDPLLEAALPLAEAAVDKNQMWRLVPVLKRILGDTP